MGATTNISWTQSTWNPWWGCIRVSPGCENCYAETFAKRLGLNIWGPSQTTDRKPASEKYWAEPLKWNRKAEAAGVRHRVFCASMGDVFEDHPQLPPLRERLWDLIRATPSLDWQLLTKRPENILEAVPAEWTTRKPGFPPNVWIGTSIENRAVMRERIAELVEVPCATRFLSCEPLLEQLTGLDLRGIHWVIGGGESNGPVERRLVELCKDGESLCGSRHWEGRRRAGLKPVAHPGGLTPDPCSVCGCTGYTPTVAGKAAVLHLRDACINQGAAFWFKQWGGPRPTSGGAQIDGRYWHQMPYHLRAMPPSWRAPLVCETDRCECRHPQPVPV